jgi:hypothetical protein
MSLVSLAKFESLPYTGRWLQQAHIWLTSPFKAALKFFTRSLTGSTALGSWIPTARI